MSVQIRTLDYSAEHAHVEVKTAGAFCPLCSRRGSNGDLQACEEGHAPLLLSWTWPSPEDYEAWYADPNAYHVEEQEANGQRAYTDAKRYEDAVSVAASRMWFLDAALGDTTRRRMLDIGAGNFAFVRTARCYGHEAYGIDPNPLSDSCLRGTWSDVEDAYNVITMHDVFEHLLHPRRCLMHLRDCLEPNGLLVIEMPEYQAPDPCWTKHIRPRQHVCLYSREAAEEMYRRAGYEVVMFLRPVMGTLGKMAHYLKKV